MKKPLIIKIIFILISLLITYTLVSEVELNNSSGSSSFAIIFGLLLLLWNLTPILVYYIILKVSLPYWKNIVSKITLILSGLALVGYPCIFMIGFKIDFHGMATSSSTSALSLLVIPIIAFMFGAIPVLAQLIFNSRMRKKSQV